MQLTGLPDDAGYDYIVIGEDYNLQENKGTHIAIKRSFENLHPSLKRSIGRVLFSSWHIF